MAFQDPRTEIAIILGNNQTLQELYRDFGVDYEQTESELIKDVLYPDDAIIQANTVYTLAENPSADPDISILNESISTVFGLFPGPIGAPHENNYRNYSSATRTSYTYFLKWIYYTYKYYNEEQFFFNNMLDKYVPNYDGQVISSTSHLKIYFDGLGILLDTLDQKIEDIYTLGNIDAVDAAYLQHIAQLLGYQKEDFSIQSISFRELIKNLIDIYQTKGTEYSFELFFKLLGFDAEVREYYWDRDAKNPEQFGSIANNDFLYYLTTQDPRLRTIEQISNPSQASSIQPVRTKDWVEPKDLRDFSRLQSSYSIPEILGFKSSGLDPADRFTYFKTNFIQFRLTQFYTKQDLTAKDTETILKYVKFLTPIYISSFVEVATTPYQDFFEMSNPDASSIVFGGDPGIPAWVDILLPFIFVTIKDYIPLQLAPATEDAVVIANYAWSDDDTSGTSDDALGIVFGDPEIGIDLEGSVLLVSNVNLSTEKYISLKIDKGRGEKVSIQGNTIQTYSQLLTRLNTALTTLGIAATASQVGISPNLDLRISSDSLHTTSKIFLATGLQNDLFSGLGITPETPVDGIQSQSGYQDFGATFTAGTDLTGLNPSTTYEFYVNVDIDDFVEVDVSGPSPAATTPLEIIAAINNHYDENIQSSFISSTTPEYISSDTTSSGKVLIGYRDTGTNNGRLVYMNNSGSIYRSGINFTLYDCRTTSVSSATGRNLVVFYDTVNNYAKWTVFDNEGVKIIIAQQLEGTDATVNEIVSTRMSNDKIAVAYTNATDTIVKTFDLTGPTVVDTKILGSGVISELTIGTSGDGVVVGGSTVTGGIIIYLEEDLEYVGGSFATATKTFTTQTSIKDVSFEEVASGDIFIAWRNFDAGGPDYTGYFTVLNSLGVPVVTPEVNFVTDDLDLVSTTITSTDNIWIVYSKVSDGIAYFQIISPTGDVIKKERVFYNNSSFTEVELNLTESNSVTSSIATSNRGYFGVWEFLGEVASLSQTDRLKLTSLNAGDTWDDTVDNYADTSDRGHLFVMDGDTYEFDNFAEYHRGLGVDFTDERNRFNTQFTSSPNDDLVPLIEEVLTFGFTLLIGSNEYPSDNVEKLGFYIQRNGYISRGQSQSVQGNREKGYYTRHLDTSQDIRDDDTNRVKREIDWPQWNKNNTADNDWSSWGMAIDYFTPSIDYPPFIMSGGAVFAGGMFGGIYYDFTAPVPTGGAIFDGAALYGPFFEYIAPTVNGSIYSSGTSLYEAFYLYIAPEAFGGPILSGDAVTEFTYEFAYTTTGGIDISGINDIDEIGYIPEATGGAVLSGIALTDFGNAYIASGEMTLSHADITADEIEFIYNDPTIPRFMTLGGSAEYEYDISYATTGGMILSGESPFVVETVTEASGGMTLGGTAPFEFSIDRIMEGGMILSGTPDLDIEFVYDPSGEAVLSGEAEYSIEIARDMDGGIIVQGSGAYQEAGL